MKHESELSAHSFRNDNHQKSHNVVSVQKAAARISTSRGDFQTAFGWPSQLYTSQKEKAQILKRAGPPDGIKGHNHLKVYDSGVHSAVIENDILVTRNNCLQHCYHQVKIEQIKKTGVSDASFSKYSMDRLLNRNAVMKKSSNEIGIRFK